MITNLREKGFTLLELIVAISVFSVLILTVSFMVVKVFNGSKSQFLAISNVEQARLVTSQFVNEIRNATTGVDGSYSLGQADDSQIIFYSKTIGSSTINRVRYYLNGTDLYKGIIVPTGSPQVYNVAFEVKKIVQSNVVNGGVPIFNYYDGNFNGASSPISQPANVNLVKFIKINLIVLTKINEQSGNTFTVSTGATIRNLKTNLGN